MDYDVTALTQEIKDKAKDSSLSDSLITSWLQETQDSVLGHYRFPFLEEIEAITLDQGDLTHAYPEDLQTVLGVSLKRDTQVTEPDYLPYEEFDARFPNPDDATAGLPWHYTDYGRVLYWNQPLDQAYDLKLKYLRRPVTLASGSVTPDIPVEYKQLLIYGTLGRVEEYRENFDIASLHFRKVEDLSEDMLQRYGTRQLARPHYASMNGRMIGQIRRR